MIASIIYNLFIRLYRLSVGIAATTGNQKAKKWVEGRHHWASQLREQHLERGAVVWVHAASLGEFEQGRPVLEAIRAEYPGHKILLTFFSPSGYEVRRNYPGADYICYLPLDTRANARQFVEIVRPKLVIFIKYEFWLHFLTELHTRKIPVLLISGIFRKDQVFFKRYGGMFRRLLAGFTHLFLQNQASLELLQQLGLKNISVSGDTRFDRVAALLRDGNTLPLIEKFGATSRLLVAGSTWPEDEQLLAGWWHRQQHPGLKLVIAPHEIHETHIQAILQHFPNAVRYSTLKENWQEASVLIIDNIGMLTTLYKYATIAYVGGGLGKGGIHNILEPAVYGMPVIIGPVYEKYFEAVELVAAGGALVVKDQEQLGHTLQHLLTDEAACKKTAAISKSYVMANQGATPKIMDYIQEKRFLSNV
ncbi:3-deoxy-D-manno-octulosonic-acid transferase [Chitinophaga jiangningensis]|uniref:3-deoxy-D-manno-octulosonic acid transferase n=1 Tax=Chitinophaga jiangningensis TaxID=1419482 RepID=A0A1M7FEA4_9BACT|nr:glycosyltransferase N-terminal domain-containing protein [Chitinophaga jiangningensis]SHM02404.1 3-deoxy-D-manno-octulosonic-acid transferase [Chitinophaga jiangningensis]